MHAANISKICHNLYGLQRIRFGREGVFDSEHLYRSQSYMYCIIGMSMYAYTCTDIDIHTRMNAYTYIDDALFAFCITLAQVL